MGGESQAEKRGICLSPHRGSRSADKYRGQGTGKIISLRRQEEGKRGTQAEDWDDERCRDGVFFVFKILYLFNIITRPELCQAVSRHSAPPTCDAQLCLL